MEQSIQTETQADRVAREEDAKAQKQGRTARGKAAAAKAEADSWLTRQFASLSDGASSTLVVANLAGVIGLGTFLGFRAWGLYEKGRLGWKSVGLGVGIFATVGVFEGVFAK